MAAEPENGYDWQTTRDTIRERNKHMFNNTLMSDVSFIVGLGNQVQEFPAHNYVLSISSPVFYPMFYGDAAERGDTINLPDCDGESFKEFLRFVYCDEVNLDANCVLAVLYLGKKYIVPALVKKSLAFLEENLNAENVITILVHARRYDEVDLEKRCLDLIDGEAADVFKGDDFLNATPDVLKTVLTRDTLNLAELKIFQAVDRWAEEVCQRKGIEAVGSNKRDILLGVIELIRFPTMSGEEFGCEVVPKGILEEKDCLQVLMKLASAPSPHLKFNDKHRTLMIELSRCPRFNSVAHGWNCRGIKFDGIGISTSVPIAICGVRLLGSENNSYSVSLELRDDKEIVLRSVPTKDYISSAGGTRGFIGFDVIFDQPLNTNSHAKYFFRAKIAGARSWKGVNGLPQTTVEGVQFAFFDYPGCNNGTEVSRGQFAEVLFVKL